MAFTHLHLQSFEARTSVGPSGRDENGALGGFVVRFRRWEDIAKTPVKLLQVAPTVVLFVPVATRLRLCPFVLFRACVQGFCGAAPTKRLCTIGLNSSQL